MGTNENIHPASLRTSVPQMINHNASGLDFYRRDQSPSPPSSSSARWECLLDNNVHNAHVCLFMSFLPCCYNKAKLLMAHTTQTHNGNHSSRSFKVLKKIKYRLSAHIVTEGHISLYTYTYSLIKIEIGLGSIDYKFPT